MSASSLSGFGHAPINKAICLAAGVASILFQASRSNSRKLSLSQTSSSRQAWLAQLLHQALVLERPVELVFGLACLYHFRLVERQIGSAKYGVFVAVSMLVSWSLQQAASRWLLSGAAGSTHTTSNPWTQSLASSGPYSLIFSSFVQFFFNVPALSRFTVLGCQFSDKVFIYLVGLQLWLGGGTRSLIAGGAGLLAGILYRVNVCGVRKWKVPSAVCRLASRTVGRLLVSRTPEAAPAVAGASNQAQSQQQEQHGPSRPYSVAGTTAVQRRGAATGQQASGVGQADAGTEPMQPPAGLITASPDAVAQLVAMGFEPEAATQALQAAHNDVQAAISLLV